MWVTGDVAYIDHHYPSLFSENIERDKCTVKISVAHPADSFLKKINGHQL